jgi:hypothetical protein
MHGKSFMSPAVEAKNVTVEHLVNLISVNCILDELIAGSDQAVVDAHVASCLFSFHQFASIAVSARFPFILLNLLIIITFVVSCIVHMLLINVMISTSSKASVFKYFGASLGHFIPRSSGYLGISEPSIACFDSSLVRAPSKAAGGGYSTRRFVEKCHLDLPCRSPIARRLQTHSLAC